MIRGMSASLYHVDYNDSRTLLRKVRVSADMTQMQIADALKLGQSYVSKLERCVNFVDVLLYARWCQVCGVKPGAALDEILDATDRKFFAEYHIETLPATSTTAMATLSGTPFLSYLSFRT